MRSKKFRHLATKIVSFECACIVIIVNLVLELSFYLQYSLFHNFFDWSVMCNVPRKIFEVAKIWFLLFTTNPWQTIFFALLWFPKIPTTHYKKFPIWKLSCWVIYDINISDDHFSKNDGCSVYLQFLVRVLWWKNASL